MKTNIAHKVEDSAPINDFNGHYQFLNNDHPAWVSLDSVLYPSVSVAYQAARTDNLTIRQALNEVETYQKFKEIAMGIPNPNDWNGRKYKVMQKLLRDKFKRNKEFRSKLASTFPRNLINTFKQGGQNQSFWGVIQGKGSNNLGKILMSIRQQIQSGRDWQNWINDQGVQNDQKMRPTVSLIITRQQKAIDKLFLQKKSKFFFGSQKEIDFKLDHPSISKIHACIYFGYDLNIMIADLGSSNGTSIIRLNLTFKLQPLKPIALQKNDIIIFGLSSRRYKVDIDAKIVQEFMKEQQRNVEEETRLLKGKEKIVKN